MHTPMPTTPTLITEAIRCIACVQPFKRSVKAKIAAYTVIAYSY